MDTTPHTSPPLPATAFPAINMRDNDARHGLAGLRELLANETPQKPIFLTDILPKTRGQTVGQWTTWYQQHRSDRRVAQTAMKKQGAAFLHAAPPEPVPASAMGSAFAAGTDLVVDLCPDDTGLISIRNNTDTGAIDGKKTTFYALTMGEPTRKVRRAKNGKTAAASTHERK